MTVPVTHTDAAIHRRLIVEELIKNISLSARANPADTTISTTEASESEISITIPADWNTYNVDVIVSCFVEHTGSAAAQRGYILRVREGTGTGGSIVGQQQGLIGIASPDSRAPASFYGYTEGETDTGSITWALTSIVTGDDAQYSMMEIRWKVTASRVT